MTQKTPESSRVSYSTTLELRGPIVEYETRDDSGVFCFEWPASLTLIYQHTFFQKQYALLRAWQEIPVAGFVGLIDRIKTKVLQLALDLKNELAEVDDELSEITPEKVNSFINVHIYGGNNVIASENFSQYNFKVPLGDLEDLRQALKTLGIPESSITELSSAIEEDRRDFEQSTKPELGRRTSEWLKQLPTKFGEAALKIGTGLVLKHAEDWIKQYLGL